MIQYQMRPGYTKPEPIKAASRLSPDRGPRLPMVTCPSCGRHEVRSRQCSGCFHVHG